MNRLQNISHPTHFPTTSPLFQKYYPPFQQSFPLVITSKPAHLPKLTRLPAIPALNNMSNPDRPRPVRPYPPPPPPDPVPRPFGGKLPWSSSGNAWCIRIHPPLVNLLTYQKLTHFLEIPELNYMPNPDRPRPVRPIPPVPNPNPVPWSMENVRVGGKLPWSSSGNAQCIRIYLPFC